MSLKGDNTNNNRILERGIVIGLSFQYVIHHTAEQDKVALREWRDEGLVTAFVDAVDRYLEDNYKEPPIEEWEFAAIDRIGMRMSNENGKEALK